MVFSVLLRTQSFESRNARRETCAEPALKADFDDLQSNLMTLKSQHDCPDALKVEDILETMYPASKRAHCKLCCE
ncbi:unnamed protein product [Rodentolepis nana]|uniref:Uncharacterized protein n=1 Tax=Rodentolepis nana TaxID=102285 RepID=A0A0R3TYR6_RODNA|nr:unnamed protein product [Rodentolepis nana]